MWNSKRRPAIIIVEGPDGTGKTILARALSTSHNLQYVHFHKDSVYTDYIEPLSKLQYMNAVLDRCFFSEYPYASVMERKFTFSLKQWHNLVMLTLAQSPLIILCTHKPDESNYPSDQYLPYSRWDSCMLRYKELFHFHHIPYVEYDYTKQPAMVLVYLGVAKKFAASVDWWAPMWEAGWGCVGSTSPKVLLVAERIGPNNTHSIPFETGPTGYMLSELLAKTNTPLGDFAVTNLVKSFRRDTREPNDQDLELLGIELNNLNPKKIIFLGSIARAGIKEAERRGINHIELPHFGAYSHRGDRSVDRYVQPWLQVFGPAPTLL